MAKKIATATDEITLTEAKLAMEYLKTFGGADSIVEYLKPLRQFLTDFGTLERFDYVIEKTNEAIGKHAAPVEEATVEAK